MARTTAKPHIKPSLPPPLLSGKERLAIWEKARGTWKHREPAEIDKELTKLRKEWDRKII